jgi:hypothetical protein
MTHKVSECLGCTVRASDGDVGTVVELYFDDVTWRIRYLAVKMARSAGRTVLLSVAALRQPDWQAHVIQANHTLGQICNSPVADIARPVTRQHEVTLHRHYLWPVYWVGGFYELPRLEISPGADGLGTLTTASPHVGVRQLEPQVRGLRDVTNCRVRAADGLLGQVHDALFDDETWSMRYLVVNMQAWLPDRLVLVSPHWLTKVSWPDHEIRVDLTREIIKKSPKVHLSQIGTTDYEQKLLGHLQQAPVAEWVLFKVHAPSGAAVHVTGTFNQWHPTALRLAENGNGVYTNMVLLPAGRYEYKFLVNGMWRNGPVGVEQVPNPFGSTNSVLVVGRQPKPAGHLHTFDRESDGEGGPVLLGNWQGA